MSLNCICVCVCGAMCERKRMRAGVPIWWPTPAPSTHMLNCYYCRKSSKVENPLTQCRCARTAAPVHTHIPLHALIHSDSVVPSFQLVYQTRKEDQKKQIFHSMIRYSIFTINNNSSSYSSRLPFTCTSMKSRELRLGEHGSQWHFSLVAACFVNSPVASTQSPAAE